MEEYSWISTSRHSWFHSSAFCEQEKKKRKTPSAGVHWLNLTPTHFILVKWWHTVNTVENSCEKMSNLTTCLFTSSKDSCTCNQFSLVFTTSKCWLLFNPHHLNNSTEDISIGFTVQVTWRHIGELEEMSGVFQIVCGNFFCEQWEVDELSKSTSFMFQISLLWWQTNKPYDPLLKMITWVVPTKVINLVI